MSRCVPCGHALHACMHRVVQTVQPSSPQQPLQLPCLPACLQGDIVMIAATELSSQRIPWDEESTKYLLGVIVSSWFAAALAIGDYR